MALLDKIFAFKGNRQFNEAENKLIDALNNTENFIADEAFINYSFTEIFAIDKELKKFLKITIKDDNTESQIIDFDNVSSFQSEIKDRANEEWMENYSKWKTQKKFIRSISISILCEDKNDMTLFFSKSENKDGDKVSSIAVKRALFSMDKWDSTLHEIVSESEE